MRSVGCDAVIEKYPGQVVILTDNLSHEVGRVPRVVLAVKCRYSGVLACQRAKWYRICLYLMRQSRVVTNI
jgi:hypothetical protein